MDVVSLAVVEYPQWLYLGKSEPGSPGTGSRGMDWAQEDLAAGMER